MARPISEYRRDPVALVIMPWGIGEGFLARQTGTPFVGADNILEVQGVSHRFDALGVQFRQLLHVLDNLAQLLCQAVKLLLPKL